MQHDSVKLYAITHYIEYCKTGELYFINFYDLCGEFIDTKIGTDLTINNSCLVKIDKFHWE